MKIALIGYGKMGQMIEKMAIAAGHSVVARITSQSWDLAAIQSADVCIEFTNPESAIANIKRIAELKKNVIIGTTGWYDKLDIVQSIVQDNKIGLLYGSNFSVGIYLFMKILNQASRLMNSFEEYDIAGIEYHHNKKKDSPSGTAREIASIIEMNVDRIDTLPLTSVRCGSIPGTHTILFDSPCDTISMTHEARNREGFAKGALLAAQWISVKTGVYTFDECMKEHLRLFPGGAFKPGLLSESPPGNSENRRMK